MNFSEFHFEPQLAEGLSYMNFKDATPVQQQAIPLIMQGRDLIACAQTGTGKTAAYLLPVLNNIIKSGSKGINTLVIVPTRELALQIDQQLEGFSYFVGISHRAIFGGSDGIVFESEKRSLTEGADVLIATPGRLMAHLAMGYVKFDTLKHLILDEADRMLDMGFVDDIMKIISYLPKQRQTLMFSATMPHKIRELAHKILHQPEQINIAVSKPAEGILQAAYLTYDQQKTPLLKELVAGKDIDSVIVFASTKQKVKNLERELVQKGVRARAIHSDLEQSERENVMLDFKHRKFPVLVATDIVSRGIDIEGIGLVVNYDVPGDAEDYVHRIGRTARADRTGVAITFINEPDIPKFFRIERLLEKEVKKLPLPIDLGQGPAYDPSSHSKQQRRGGGGFRKKGFSRNKRK